MRGVGGGVGGPPLRDHLWQGPPLPVTLRLIHPPPKMTQGVMTPLTPLHPLQQHPRAGSQDQWVRKLEDDSAAADEPFEVLLRDERYRRLFLPRMATHG